MKRGRQLFTVVFAPIAAGTAAVYAVQLYDFCERWKQATEGFKALGYAFDAAFVMFQLFLTLLAEMLLWRCVINRLCATQCEAQRMVFYVLTAICSLCLLVYGVCAWLFWGFESIWWIEFWVFGGWSLLFLFAMLTVIVVCITRLRKSRRGAEDLYLIGWREE